MFLKIEKGFNFKAVIKLNNKKRFINVIVILEGKGRGANKMFHFHFMKSTIKSMKVYFRRMIIVMLK